ncbi:MAG: CinA family protein [Oscillospiraceae bacterium]|nr:CinA family protein [Oscillospiraceae bacterium]
MNEIYEKISELSRQIVKLCTEHGIKVATAESCTGGMISAAITSVPGSSAVIELGVCSYSNRIKREVLGVSVQTLEELTEYSCNCVEEMAEGVLRLSGADFAVSTSGLAGPSGGTEDDPVGTVYICVCSANKSISERFEFPDTGRDKIRAAATKKALEILLDTIQ